MYENRKCPCCESSEMISGSVRSTGKGTFRPDNVKFAVPKTANVGVSGVMCLDCGYVGMTGDTVKARKLVKLAKV